MDCVQHVLSALWVLARHLGGRQIEYANLVRVTDTIHFNADKSLLRFGLLLIYQEIWSPDGKIIGRLVPAHVLVMTAVHGVGLGSWLNGDSRWETVRYDHLVGGVITLGRN